MKNAFVLILGVLVMTGVVTLDGKTVAGIGVAIESVLALLYVRPLTVSKAGINALIADPEVKPLGDPAPPDPAP